MTTTTQISSTVSLTTAALILAATGSVFADAGTVTQAVNAFENAKATGGAAMTVDAKGPVDITDAVELPGFAFNVYDVDVTPNSLTMQLVAQLEKLQITLYDNTTFDRYYFEFDQQITEATIADTSDENFSATVEVIAPNTTLTTAGAFVDGLASEFTFENGGILVTVGEGTDLTKVSANSGSLTVNF